MSTWCLDRYTPEELIKAKRLLRGSEHLAKMADRMWERGEKILMKKEDGGRGKKGRCYACGMRGHHYDTCVLRLLRSNACFRCGHLGHKVNTCSMNCAAIPTVVPARPVLKTPVHPTRSTSPLSSISTVHSEYEIVSRVSSSSFEAIDM